MAKEFPGGKIPPDYGYRRGTTASRGARTRASYGLALPSPAVGRKTWRAAHDHHAASGYSPRSRNGTRWQAGRWCIGCCRKGLARRLGRRPMTARTDADGNYVIDDVPPFDLKAQAEQEAAMRSGKDAAMNAFRASPQVLILTVEHPNFAVGKAQIEKTPGTTDIQLQPAAILVGRIVFGDSGKPAGGARVWIAGHHQKLSETKRDDAGNNDEQRRYAMPFYTASTRADCRRQVSIRDVAAWLLPLTGGNAWLGECRPSRRSGSSRKRRPKFQT